jgi:hypothetical protein
MAADGNVVVSDDDMRWAESAASVLPCADGPVADLLSVAKTCALAIGREVARRLKNQEMSIFHDGGEWRVRNAFDHLSWALSRATPFRDGGDGVAEALVGLLAELRSDPAFVNATYRDTAQKYADIMTAADEALLRWSERPVGFDIASASLAGAGTTPPR